MSLRPHRVVDHQISHSVYLFDPDGNYIEVYADVSPDWRAVYARSAGQLVTGSWDPDDSPASAEPMYESAPAITVVDDALVHPTRVCGATLAVTDLGASASFYAEVIGLDIPEMGAKGYWEGAHPNLRSMYSPGGK